jgi:hypothetical protein
MMLVSELQIYVTHTRGAVLQCAELRGPGHGWHVDPCCSHRMGVPGC